MEGSKWQATVASIWIQCSTGSYTFGIYSSVLKSSQGYDQSTLGIVSVSKDIASNVGVLAGILYAAAERGGVGSWVVQAVGAIQCFVGYFFMWLAVTGVIDRPRVWVMCFFMSIAAHSQPFLNTANIVVAVHNFPDYRGTTAGIMKGFLGLSGPILIQVYQTFFNGKPTTFLLILALFPTIVTFLLMFLVKVYPSHTGREKKHLDGFSALVLAIAAYLIILIVANNIFTFPLWVRIVSCGILVLLISSPLLIAIDAQKEESRKPSEAMSIMTTPLVDHAESLEPAAEGIVTCHHDEEIPICENQNNANSKINMTQIEEKDLLQAMCTMNFWLLFIAMICGMGSGLATFNCITQMGESLRYSTTEINTLVSLWGIWNFLGRFGAGYLSDYLLQKRGWGRPVVMALTHVTMTAGFLIMASGFQGNLYVGSIIVGICYGSQHSLNPCITSDIFGVLHMGTIFNAIGAASPVGSYLLSVRVIGYVYDKEAASSEGKSCYGTHCFMLSFFIFASVSLFGSLISLLLFFGTRRSYSLLLLNR